MKAIFNLFSIFSKHEKQPKTMEAGIQRWVSKTQELCYLLDTSLYVCRLELTNTTEFV